MSASSSRSSDDTSIAIEQVAAARRPVEAAEHIHQSRFAGAARAHDRHEFALADLERNPAHCVHLHFAGTIALLRTSLEA